MSRWKIGAALLSVFLAGVISGIAVTGVVIYRHHRRMLQEGPPATQKLILKRLARRLDLSPEQQQVMGPIVADTHNRLLAIGGRALPEMKAILDDGVLQARRVLRPDQQERLGQMRSRLDSLLEVRFGGQGRFSEPRNGGAQ